jgi:hypothetical protein
LQAYLAGAGPGSLFVAKRIAGTRDKGQGRDKRKGTAEGRGGGGGGVERRKDVDHWLGTCPCPGDQAHVRDVVNV